LTPTNRPRSCPPGQVQRTPTAPCTRPVQFMTPTAGPASGLWPQGSSVRPSAPAPGPSTPPSPSCVGASIFSDCFASCVGMISGGSPGPVCGWTFIEPFGPLGGSVTLSPGNMTFNVAAATDDPVDTKSLPVPLGSVNGITGQFGFTEFATPPGPNTSYVFVLNNQALNDSLVIALFGDTSVVVQVGDPANGSNYISAWTPNNGSHVVSFQVDSSGVPLLWIDGLSIPLMFIGMGTNIGSLLPANSVSFAVSSGDPTPATAPVKNLFITTGALPPQTRFCCP